MLETYLKRSGSVPLEVQIHDPSPHLLESLAPHISRLSSLTVALRDLRGFELIVSHLGNPIPTLNEFSIVGGGYGLTIPSNIGNGHFLYVKKLRLVQVSSLRAPHAFPQVTQLVWIVNSHYSGSASNLLDTLVGLPALERVEIAFQKFPQCTQIPRIDLVTLPNLRWMSLDGSGEEIPNLLEFLKLPSLTSLVVSGIWGMRWPFDTLPAISFSENLPNFAELPEMEVGMCREQNRVAFRSPSQATLDYYTKPLSLGQGHYANYRKPWGGLPVDSIRRLVVDMEMMDGDDAWVVGLLRDLKSLEHLEFRSRCGCTPRYLRRMMMEGNSFPEMKTLAVYFGPEREARQVHRLKDVADGLDSGISVTWVRDSAIPDDGQ